MASLVSPRIPGNQIRETLKALEDVMEAIGASARDDLSKAHWQFTHNNVWRRGNIKGWSGVCNHTNTAGSHIGSNHDGALAGLELVQDPIALVLLFVTMDGCIHR
jgi:hypothetical protein